MVAFGSVLITFGTISTSLGNPLSSRPYAVKERHIVPQKWTRLGRAPADAVLELRIALKQSKFDELERHLYEGQFPLCINLWVSLAKDML
jgi:tripeptidyl-peptidase I